MKYLVSIIFITSILNATDQPTMVELQKLIGQFKEAYGVIDDDKSNKKFDINRKVTEKELKDQVDEMNRLLKSNPKLQYHYGK